MLRHFGFSLVALVLVAGVALAADKAKGKTVGGAFASYKDGTLTIKVTAKKGEEAKAQEFKVTDDIKVTILDGKTKKEGTAKDAFKDVKEGTQVTVTIGEDDKVASILVGKPDTGKTVSGAFVSSKDSTLTIKVTVKKGEEPKAQDFKVADDIKVTIYDGATKKEGTAKDAFKEVKEGTPVTITIGDGDKVAAIQVGTASKVKGKTVSGALASFKEGTLTIKVTFKKGDEPKVQEFKVTDDIMVTTLDGKTKKEGTAKDAFKDAKEGTPVTITLSADDKVASIQVGTANKVVKGKSVSGALASYKDGTLTIKVAGKKGDEPKAQEFKVADDIKVTTFEGKTKKEGVAKDAFKDVKEGTSVTVQIDADNKITAIQVGKVDQEKGKTVSGEMASYKDGTLTIKVKGKKGEEAKAQDFKIADNIKVTTFDADTKKEGIPKDAFKDVKEGTQITISLGEDDKITAIQVGNAPKKKQ